MLSLIIVSHRRPLLLSRLLESIHSQASSHELEIIIALNGELRKDHPKTSLLHTWNASSLRIIEIERTTSAAARNQAIHHAHGEWIGFLDDDVVLPTGYLNRARQLLATFPQAEALGGPDQTPPLSNLFQQSVGLALASPFTTGRTFFRHSRVGTLKSDTDETRLILCNLWIKSSVFRERGLRFPPEYGRNEENVLLYQLKTAGAQLVSSPDLFVFHERRRKMGGLLNQAFRSGRYRIHSFNAYPKSRKAIFFMPLINSIYWLSALKLVFLAPLYGLPGLIYLTTSFVSSYLVTSHIKSNRLRTIPLTFCIQVLIHWAYGTGTAFGILESITNPGRLARLTLSREPQ